MISGGMCTHMHIYMHTHIHTHAHTICIYWYSCTDVHDTQAIKAITNIPELVVLVRMAFEIYIFDRDGGS